MEGPRISRMCRNCHEDRPIHEFRRRSAANATRVNECRSCHNRAERIRRAAARASEMQNEMAKTLTAFKNERDNARLARLAGEMLGRHGGTEKFLDAWEVYYNRSMDEGGFAAFRCIESMLRLIRYCNEEEEKPAELEQEDLESTIREQTAQLIRQCPTLAISAAKELGWTVIPPKRSSLGQNRQSSGD